MLEALLILVSVGLAFGVAEYRESRANHELAGRVLRSLQSEVEHNLGTLEPWTAFNVRFRHQLAKADPSDASKSGLEFYVSARPPLPAGSTVDTMQELHNGNVGRQVAAMHAARAFDPASRVAVFRQARAGHSDWPLQKNC